MDNVTSICNNVDSLTTTLNTLPLNETIEEVYTLIDNIKEATAQLNKTDNTAGKLLNDEELYDRINGAIVSLDSLLIDIRQNPKRYINVTVFGRKEKESTK
jgi:phospholipid/cholesterol/gamma-HCH transport system substrate-binding protein